MVRTRIELYRDILERTKVESRITQIVYGCNLNFKTVRKYLKHLIGKKLMRKVVIRDKAYYVTTDKGLTALKTLKTF